MWPFKDEATGAKVYKDKFYGFGDSGFLAGSFAGYDSRDEAIRKIQQQYEDCELGTIPEHLGAYGITVLSGDEYVKRLKTIVDGDDLTIFGSWSEAPTKAYIRDQNYKGAYIVLADSYEDALLAMQRRNPVVYKDMSLDDFKKAFEEIDIAHGMVLETAGDF